MKFNIPIEYTGDNTTSRSFPCSSVFDNALAVFGTDECSLNTAKDSIFANMQHNRGVTASTGTSITVKAGSVKPASKLSTVMTTSLKIQNPSTLQAPVAAIIAPQGIDLCTISVTMKASQSSGAGYLTYAWSSTTNTALNTFLQSQQADAVEIVLTTEYLPTFGATDRICLSVTDVLAETSVSKCHEITRSSLPEPTVWMISSREVTLETNQQNTLEGAAVFSACVGRQTLKYRWTLPSSINTSNIELGYRTLVLPINALPAGLNAQFVLEAWAQETPANVGRTTVNVATTYPALRCQISGGSGERSTLETLVLDAATSYDPAGLNTTVSWSCFNKGQQCVRSTGAPVEAVAQSASGLSHVSANTMQSGTYEWTATVRDAAGNAATRIKSCKVVYTMVGKSVLTVKVETPENANYVDQQFISGTRDGQDYNFIANVESKLQLACSTTVVTDEPITFAWTMPVGLSSPIFVTNKEQLSTGVSNLHCADVQYADNNCMTGVYQEQLCCL